MYLNVKQLTWYTSWQIDKFLQSVSSNVYYVDDKSASRDHLSNKRLSLWYHSMHLDLIIYDLAFRPRASIRISLIPISRWSDCKFWSDALKVSDPRSDHVRYHICAKPTKYWFYRYRCFQSFVQYKIIWIMRQRWNL